MRLRQIGTEQVFIEPGFAVGAPEAIGFAEDEAVAQSSLGARTADGFLRRCSTRSSCHSYGEHVDSGAGTVRLRFRKLPTSPTRWVVSWSAPTSFRPLFRGERLGRSSFHHDPRPIGTVRRGASGHQVRGTEIQSESISGQDVTQEFTDLQSRLRNLEAAEEQLLEIMEAATDTEDVFRSSKPAPGERRNRSHQRPDRISFGIGTIVSGRGGVDPRCCRSAAQYWRMATGMDGQRGIHLLDPGASVPGRRRNLVRLLHRANCLDPGSAAVLRRSWN